MKFSGLTLNLNLLYQYISDYSLHWQQTAELLFCKHRKLLIQSMIFPVVTLWYIWNIGMVVILQFCI